MTSEPMKWSYHYEVESEIAVEQGYAVDLYDNELTLNGTSLGCYISVDAAKAAAQADYERRQSIEALEAENARLAAALEPFANAAKAYLIEELDDDYRPDWSPFIPYGAYRAARRAREGGNADG